MSNSINVGRLLALRDLLRDRTRVPTQQFDIGLFWTDRSRYEDSPGCGSCGCALGWYAHYQLGDLRLWHPTNSARFSVADRRDAERLNNQSTSQIRPESQGYSAAMQEFGIGHDDAEHLFDPDAYEEYEDGCEDVSPERVANRIEEFLQSRGLI